ncbi:DUF4389 domain-containing protein [Geodermatophilus sabuli]|uniref:DUF4389 domain-containing protein n=1 Tax=Geodermatophilus sabuli TaxID=1564158 RepID=A0A285EIZ0_9ACTN|nr:DUF4389 domain-containing protein [Geodermatophilus sabuli]MBB3083625.1 hypothetical protein [Geodermatophilus sabuli]SNX99055.1 protein of unknown function [Geodermatophilus sabuli]
MTEEHAPYPVRVEAAMDRPLSRWLWLVKWFLLIPHVVVLAFLWVAFVVLTVVAWFAILVTGRYPRPLFAFTVGVLRWSWRVHYYGYGALGTDRYPPFTLADVPDYPARLDVPYPERLSRGLVLVKSWLLALPHLLLLSLFVGGGIWLAGGDGPEDSGWAAGGLIGLLVLVAGIVLLFTGRYPQPVYDFVLGLDRWVLRVAAYVALMTDRYPPFRLDMGGADPGTRPVGPGGPRPQGPTAAPVPPAGWSAGRVVAVVVGALLLFTSTGLLVGGASLAWADTTQREDGYLSTPTGLLSTSRYALVTGSITLDVAGDEWLVDDVLGDARLQVTPADPDVAVFLGVARAADAGRYLAGVGHRQVQETSPDGRLTGGRDVPGSAPTGAPGDLDIWVAQAEGAGTQTVDWTPADGDWTVVVMRADGSAGVDVGARAGVTAPALPWLWGALLLTGAVLLVAGALLVGLAVHRAVASPGPAGGVPAPPIPPPGPPVVPPAPRSAPSTDQPVGRLPEEPR